jgi:hypothetical protein
MKNPIEFGNILLILMGILLVWSGPYISYRTVKGMIESRKKDPKANLHIFNNGLNFIIAVLFSMAGVLFIINNLKGNPLH